jgi:hypothetical protein
LVVSLYVSLSYLHASRQLKAMEAQDRSPLFAHFAETVTGRQGTESRSCEGGKRVSWGMPGIGG